MHFANYPKDSCTDRLAQSWLNGDLKLNSRRKIYSKKHVGTEFLIYVSALYSPSFEACTASSFRIISNFIPFAWRDQFLAHNFYCNFFINLKH